jgi:predicted ferric reductase
MSSQLTWYLARAGGLVAWSLAAASVLWGLGLSTRALGRRPRPNWLYDLHRFLGGLALVFTGVHVLSVLVDRYVHFGLVNVLVPFTGSWHPVAVAWGILAFYLLLAVELTSLLRVHLSARLWRRVHFGSFALFALSSLHAITAGSDAGSGPFFDIVVAVSGLVAVMTVVRTRRSLSGRAAGRSISIQLGRERRPPGRVAVPPRPDRASGRLVSS